jgi:glycine hydroxymethyltransferase
MAKVKNSFFLDSMRAQEKWRVEECINLLPSENASSPQVRALLSADFSNRYNLPIMKDYLGEFLENAYRGTRITYDVELRAEDVAKEVFGARYACVQPLSGHIAALITIISTTKRGDTILAVSPDHGGYDGYAPPYIPDILGLKSIPLPFDDSVFNVKSKEAASLIRRTKPALVILGASSILFPYDIKTVSEACSAVGATLAYDGSHVLGLIAGGEFQRPLKEGVDILYGSTHKTFFGPQGGLIVTNSKEMNEKVRSNLVWRVMDNAHWNRIAALGQALLEMRAFGQRYARQVVRNSQRFGKELKVRGFPVQFEEFGFSRSHQLLYDQKLLKERFGKAVNDFSVMLERSNLIIDSVGRLGTPEITRMGFKEKDIPSLADIFIAAAKGENVKKDVKALRDRFDMEFRFGS